jgi:phosphate transport system permease protein
VVTTFEGVGGAAGHGEIATPRDLTTIPTRGDVIYRRLATGAGLSTLVIMVLIFTFLLWKSWDALSIAGWSFVTETAFELVGDPPVFGVAALLFGTVVIAAIALALAVPIAIATALFINEFAPIPLRKPLIALIDLLAAIPSIIYGIWGRNYLSEKLFGPGRWLDDQLGFIPIFNSRPGGGDYRLGASTFVAGIVVAIMVLPIATSVIREVFSQAPRGECEAALALGGTRFGMVKAVILPFGRGGIIGGSMLALGRALGETIAVALIVSPAYKIKASILETGGNSVAAEIANQFGEAANNPIGVSALMAAGLALFLMTLFVNMGANVVIGRSRSGAGVDL